MGGIEKRPLLRGVMLRHRWRIDPRHGSIPLRIGVRLSRGARR